MQEHECFPDNSFSDSIPDIDVECGCVENYDLTDWNDTEPIDDENGSFNPMPDVRPHGAPCLTSCPTCPECPECPDCCGCEDCTDCCDCPVCPELTAQPKLYEPVMPKSEPRAEKPQPNFSCGCSETTKVQESSADTSYIKDEYIFNLEGYKRENISNDNEAGYTIVDI